jgi:hydrogenase maturation protease
MVERIAKAVLYEGYLLYPYRPSAVKNRQRFNFGVVYPRAYSEAESGTAPWEMETECLALGGPLAVLEVKVRCLRLVDRVVGREVGAGFVPADSIEVDGQTYESWQEAAECEMKLPEFRFAELEAGPVRQRFVHPATRAVEHLGDGAIVRTQEQLECGIELSLEAVERGAGTHARSAETHLGATGREESRRSGHECLRHIRVCISNFTPLADEPPVNREAVLGRSLLSAHTILRVRGGEFVSLLEPPPPFQEAADACKNVGTYPVLAGEPGQRDTVLSSPIILYDYPQIAPESPGDLFDGAEIDEILSLRILALTDDEKAAMRRSDERARRILERTETLPPEHFMKLHGALRGMPGSGKEAS